MKTIPWPWKVSPMNAGHLYTPADDQRLIARYQAGEKLSTIARTLGRSRESIKQRLDTLANAGRIPQRRTPGGIAPPEDPRGITDEDRAWMAYWRQPREVRRNAATR